MNTIAYTSPVDKLLTIGEPESVYPDQWPDYLELGLATEHVPELIRMATDRTCAISMRLHTVMKIQSPPWAPIHAIRALGRLHAAKSIQRVAQHVLQL
jgi:hypothetical protein